MSLTALKKFIQTIQSNWQELFPVENGTLEGLGSACSYVEGNYAQDTVDTYYGEAMAVVRAGETDSVKITVCDEEKTYTREIPIVALK